MVDAYRTGTWVRRAVAVLLGIEAAVAFAIAFFAAHDSEAPRGEAAQMVTFGAFVIFALLAVLGASELWRGRGLGVAISSICFGAIAALSLVTSVSTKETAPFVSTVLNGAAMIGVLVTSRVPQNRQNRGPSNNELQRTRPAQATEPRR